MIFVVITAGLLVLGGAALWGTVAVGASESLARNPWAGIRITATLDSPGAWAAQHRAALPVARLTGVLAILLGRPRPLVRG